MTQELTATAADNHTTDLMRRAKLLSASQFLPKCYQGKPADCLVALQWAERSGRDPMELLQNSYVVHGTPGLYSRYMLALANREKVFDKPIRFVVKGEGANLSVTAVGLIDGEEYTAVASMEMARSEGWVSNPKYKGPMAEHMLKWRSCAFLIRFTAPEVLLGLYTVDELEDMHYADAREVRAEPSTLTRLEAAMKEAEPEDEEVEVENPEPEDEDVAIMRGDYDGTNMFARDGEEG